MIWWGRKVRSITRIAARDENWSVCTGQFIRQTLPSAGCCLKHIEISIILGHLWYQSKYPLLVSRLTDGSKCRLRAGKQKVDNFLTQKENHSDVYIQWMRQGFRAPGEGIHTRSPLSPNSSRSLASPRPLSLKFPLMLTHTHTGITGLGPPQVPERPIRSKHHTAPREFLSERELRARTREVQRSTLCRSVK